jgi:hypothetical protein
MADAAAEQKSLSFQVSVNHIFPTPIVRAELADHEALNAALLKSIAERRATQESTSHSNLGGWQSSWDMDQWGGPAFVALVRAAMQIVTRPARGAAMALQCLGERQWARPRQRVSSASGGVLVGGVLR